MVIRATLFSLMPAVLRGGKVLNNEHVKQLNEAFLNETAIDFYGQKLKIVAHLKEYDQSLYCGVPIYVHHIFELSDRKSIIKISVINERYKEYLDHKI